MRIVKVAIFFIILGFIQMHPDCLARCKPWACGLLLITAHNWMGNASWSMESMMACKLLPLPEINTTTEIGGDVAML